MNNPKAAFNSKFVTDHGGFRSVFATWPNLPNLFPAYTISYSAATGKPIESGKKKLVILLVLLLLLITSLAASLVLAYLWFNAIQSDYNPNDAVKIHSNFDHVGAASPTKHQIRPSANHKPNVDHIKSHLNHNNPNSNSQGNSNSPSRNPNGDLNSRPIDQKSNNGRSNHPANRPANHLTNLQERPATDAHSSSSLDQQHHKSPANHYKPDQTTNSTPQSPTVETVESANDEDGFGETASGDTAPAGAQQPPVDKDDERLIDYYKNFKNELDRNRSNKIRHEEKLDGEFVDHHLVSDVPDDEGDTRELQRNNDDQNENQNGASNTPNEPPSPIAEDYSRAESLYLPERLVSLQARQFCNLNAHQSEAHRELAALSHRTPLRNASYECQSKLNPNLISSYFCNDKFVIVAKIDARRETTVGQSTEPTERQLISKYDVHIERILKRSPFLSVAFKKQGLTTNITLDLGRLANGATTCFGQPLQLRLGQTYLLSGKISGLSAVSSNCDLQLDWTNDLDDEQRNQLMNWSASRTAFSHC